MNPPAGNIGSARTAPAPARDDTRVQEPLPHYGPDQPGSVVGSYRPMHLPGRGGMGSVWLAERHDGQFRKQVALERVNTGAVEQADLRARFLQERQILASLQHPNIVALFDGGVVGDGRPFFALEYVDGRSVNAFCDDAGQEWNRVIANAPPTACWLRRHVPDWAPSMRKPRERTKPSANTTPAWPRSGHRA